MLPPRRLVSSQARQDAGLHCESVYARVSEKLSTGSMHHLLSDDSTEPGPFHNNIPFDSPTDVRNLGPNMLSLPITIRPDHQHIRIPRFILQISFYRLRVC